MPVEDVGVPVLNAGVDEVDFFVEVDRNHRVLADQEVFSFLKEFMASMGVKCTSGLFDEVVVVSFVPAAMVVAGVAGP